MPVRITTIIAALTILFLVAPFVVVFGASFDTGGAYNIRFPPHGMSITNYLNIDPRYVAAFWNSILLAAIVAVLALSLAAMAAFGIVRGRWASPEALQSFFRLPIQIPLVVTGAVFLQFYYTVVSLTGMNPMNNLTGLVLAHVFIALPYGVGTVSSVLVRADMALEEAAEGLGATRWNTFWQVTLPALRPGLVAAGFYAFINSFGDVPVSLFLVTKESMTLPVLIFQDMLFDLQPSILAASTVVSVISIGLIILVQKLVGLDMVLPSKQKPS